MTVQQLIDGLLKIEDKENLIYIQSTDSEFESFDISKVYNPWDNDFEWYDEEDENHDDYVYMLSW